MTKRRHPDLPPHVRDICGKRFGRLTVLSFVSLHHRGPASGYTKWLCRCDCGKTSIVPQPSLRTGHTQSCGCFRAERRGQATITHGMSRTKAYRVYRSMIARCHNPNVKCYPRYGGRGIRVCRRWRESFEAFLSDVGERPSQKHQLDRIDNGGHYEPGNVRWATLCQQAQNKTSNHNLTHNGKTQCINAWARELGIDRRTIAARIQAYGWPIERALTEPVHRHHAS